MKRIYIYLVLLVLYGDLLKRVLSPSLSLIVLYAMSVGILGLILVKKFPWTGKVRLEGNVIFVMTSVLVALYSAQVMTSFFTPFVDSLSHAMYMIIPLLFIVVVQRHCCLFDLVELGKVFLVFMIPVNLIGIVQYFVDPSFFISSAYGSEQGGVIMRNLLDGGTFARFPSLYASADRYSGMGLMQLYFTFVVFKGTSSVSTRYNLWLLINLFASFVALFIAGARSRIIIAFVSLIFMVMTYLIGFIFFGKFHKSIHKVLVAVTALALVLTAISFFSEKLRQENVSFPVVGFLVQSFEQGTIENRIEESVGQSDISADISFFGAGLGTVSKGKPGEFGIKSMWIESGLFWGAMMLAAFLGIVGALFSMAIKSFRDFKPTNVLLYCVPSLLLIFALLAGFTSTFELSTGVLLGSIIAVISRSSANITGGSQQHSRRYKVNK